MSAGSAICGRCFAVYQEGYGHVCATAQADWRSLSDDLAAALTAVEWAQQTTRLKNGGTIYTAVTCPACGGEKDPPPGRAAHRAPPEGHTNACPLRAALLRYSQARGTK